MPVRHTTSKQCHGAAVPETPELFCRFRVSGLCFWLFATLCAKTPNVRVFKFKIAVFTVLISFQELVKEMVDADVQLMRNNPNA